MTVSSLLTHLRRLKIILHQEKFINLSTEQLICTGIATGFSSLPAKPNPLRQIIQESNETQITLEWDTCPDTELPVLGYKL